MPGDERDEIGAPNDGRGQAKPPPLAIRRYRITRDVEDQPEWCIDIYEDGTWVGGCCYDTFTEAVTEYAKSADAKASR